MSVFNMKKASTDANMGKQGTAPRRAASPFWRAFALGTTIALSLFFFTAKHVYSQSEKEAANLPKSKSDTTLTGLPYKVTIVGSAFIAGKGGHGSLVGVVGDSSVVKLGDDGKIKEVIVYGDTVTFEYGGKQSAVPYGKKK